MATTLTLATGPLTAQVAAANDTAAQDVIRRFALASGGTTGMTNQQLLDTAVNALRTHMVTVARRHRIEEEQINVVIETEANVGF